jgi:hypothetical protein
VSQRVARRQTLPPAECLPFKSARPRFHQRDRPQALKNQIRHPYALLDIVLKQILSDQEYLRDAISKDGSTIMGRWKKKSIVKRVKAAAYVVVLSEKLQRPKAYRRTRSILPMRTRNDSLRHLHDCGLSEPKTGDVHVLACYLFLMARHHVSRLAPLAAKSAVTSSWQIARLSQLACGLSSLLSGWWVPACGLEVSGVAGLYCMALVSPSGLERRLTARRALKGRSGLGGSKSQLQSPLLLRLLHHRLILMFVAGRTPHPFLEVSDLFQRGGH